MNLDSETKEDIDFISSLDKAGFLVWPIDYEISELNKFDASSWFENAMEEYEKHTFIEFGKDGTGSGFCLWVYPGLQRKSPVVFWSSEGEFYFVSDSLRDFIRQLCSGKMFFDGDWLEPTDEDKDEVDWLDLKRRAVDHMGEWEESPEELKDKGRKNHPNFEEWVNAHWD